MANRSGQGDRTATTTLLKGNPSGLLDEWANWERGQPDANRVDPTVGKPTSVSASG